MTALEWLYLTGLVAGAVLYLGDSINACTAAVRELVGICRRDNL